MAQILTSYSDREFKELLSEQVKDAVREALGGNPAEKTDPPTEGIGYRTRSQTRKLLGVAYSTMHYWEKAGILVPRRIGRKVFYSDEAIRNALSKAGKEVGDGTSK
ncbi:MerR family transcriptional regulator [Sphingobacterium hotanense]|uniref:MerR family transcriptional regulator n=1 Tax=Sphingobacterium TaxID=28453 RepID=UPI0021A5F7C1|nr:MerR family transcriptional regulator [Sphingobacterium hotanense]MCT1525076.1 MerR family transcriptional regulator [Sphingobacterium hotanense]